MCGGSRVARRRVIDGDGESPLTLSLRKDYFPYMAQNDKKLTVTRSRRFGERKASEARDCGTAERFQRSGHEGQHDARTDPCPMSFAA
jgi:hypothetical protein